MSGPKGVGRRVELTNDLLGRRVTVRSGADPLHVIETGEVTAYTFEPTVVISNARGELSHHIANLVHHATPAEPDWWPPQPGDVVRLEGAPPKVVWVRNHILGESTSWRSSAGELSHDSAVLYRKPTLLVRDGKPVTP